MVLGPKLISIEPGQAFDRTQWERISDEIENSVLKGPIRVGREYSFSGRRVTGSWRGKVSGVQILPSPGDFPRVPTDSGDHPFILEFPLMISNLYPLTNHRRLRKHRDLTLLLNILLAGGAKSMGRPTHCWAGTEWVQQWFSPTLDPFITDALSAPAATQLKELEPEEYDKMLGDDGMGLRVPSDLDQSICSYEALSDSHREKFDRAAFWFSTSSRMRAISISAAFAALVSAIESLTAKRECSSIYLSHLWRTDRSSSTRPNEAVQEFPSNVCPWRFARERSRQYVQPPLIPCPRRALGGVGPGDSNHGMDTAGFQRMATV